MSIDSDSLSATPTQLAPLKSPADAANPTKSAEPVIPDNIKELFGKPALLPGESQSTYDELLKQVVLCIDPKTILEWLWVKDIVDYSFDILRHQRFKVDVIGLGRRRAVQSVIAKSLHENNQKGTLTRLTDGFFFDPNVRKELQVILARLGLTEDAIDAQALIEASSDIAKVDALLGSATSRRNTAVREIERSRQQLLIATKDRAEVIEVGPDGQESKP